MIEMEVCHNRSCAIHFEGKGGEIKSFTNETLAKMLDARRQWLNMSAPYKNFTDVAKESLKLIDDYCNFNLDEINGAYGYHPSCYRYFTDISKLQRAKIAFANSSIKRTAQERTDEADFEDPDPATKVARTTRRSLGQESCCPRRSSHILPEICLICKRARPLTITDRVHKILQFNDLLCFFSPYHSEISFCFVILSVRILLYDSYSIKQY